MKKEISLLIVLGFFISSIAAVAANGFLCFPNSTCMECAYQSCLKEAEGMPCWCYDYCPSVCGEDPECLEECTKECCYAEAMDVCQGWWWLDDRMSWTEIYNEKVVGCYVEDLLCPVLVQDKTLDCGEYCSGACDYGTEEECNECLERCDSCTMPPEMWSIYLSEGESITIPVPTGCKNPRIFFSNPPCLAFNYYTYNDCISECEYGQWWTGCQDNCDTQQGQGCEKYCSYNAECLDFCENCDEYCVPENYCKYSCLNRLCCWDFTECGNDPNKACYKPCDGYYLPGNYDCKSQEIVVLLIDEIGDDYLLINGKEFYPHYTGPNPASIGERWQWQLMVVWYNENYPIPIEPVSLPGIYYLKGIPSQVTIERGFDLSILMEKKCCYECTPKPQLPATLLYPKVDIEQLSVAGGPTVIQDGKVIASLTASPGTQQAMLQVENRGFFTQRDARVRFEGLPEGVTVEVTPETQKITAHNIGTYSAIFTVDPNVPSGTYQVTIYAYSQNGVFDTITINLIVP